MISRACAYREAGRTAEIAKQIGSSLLLFRHEDKGLHPNICHCYNEQNKVSSATLSVLTVGSRTRLTRCHLLLRYGRRLTKFCCDAITITIHVNGFAKAIKNRIIEPMRIMKMLPCRNSGVEPDSSSGCRSGFSRNSTRPPKLPLRAFLFSLTPHINS